MLAALSAMLLFPTTSFSLSVGQTVFMVSKCAIPFVPAANTFLARRNGEKTQLLRHANKLLVASGAVS